MDSGIETELTELYVTGGLNLEESGKDSNKWRSWTIRERNISPM